MCEPCNHLGVLPELSELLTSIARQTHSPRLYGELGARAGLDVRPHLFGALARIRDLQPARITDVAEVMEGERSTISRQITELTSLGLVARAADPTDGRAVVVSLTPAGESVIGRVYDAWHEALGEMLAPWPDRDRTKLVALLRRLDGALDQHFSSSTTP
ncbi:MAG: MarR family transcriptional regulator [Actinomycetia bacterium]|nr:MarR family transcriptional regulator [Actinomycetes bacterium]